MHDMLILAHKTNGEVTASNAYLGRRIESISYHNSNETPCLRSRTFEGRILCIQCADVQRNAPISDRHWEDCIRGGELRTSSFERSIYTSRRSCLVAGELGHTMQVLTPNLTT